MQETRHYERHQKLPHRTGIVDSRSEKRLPLKNTGSVQLPSTRHRLVCQECGHDQRFIQVMFEEVHLVDGNFNYIRLIQGVVDHYIY